MVALARKRVSIPVNAGKDERSDPKKVQPPKALLLAEVDLSETGAIKKRRPYASVASNVEKLIANGRQGTIGSDGYLLDYDDTLGSISDRDSTYIGPQVRHHKNTLKSSTHISYRQQSVLYSAAGARLFVGFTENVSDSWHIACLDPDTLKQLNSYDDETPWAPTPIPTEPVHLLEGQSGYVTAVYVEGTNLRLFQATNVNATAWTAKQTLETDVHASLKTIAVAQSDNDTAWVVYVETSGDIKVITLDLSDFSTGTVDTLTTGGNVTLLDIHYYDTPERPRVVFQDSVDGVVLYNPYAPATQVVEASATTGVANVTLGPGPGGDPMVAYDWDSSTPTDAWVYLHTFNVSTLALIAAEEVTGAQYIDSKPFKRGGDLFMVLRYSPDPSGATDAIASRFLCGIGLETGSALQANPVANLSYSIARRNEDSAWLSPIASDGSDKLWWVGRNYRGYQDYGGLFGVGSAVQTDVSLYTWDFALHRVAHNVSAHGMQVFAGGCPLFYDDDGSAELGPLVAPVIDSVASSNGSGSLTDQEFYTWIAVYEFADSRGRIWRSPPSLPFTHEMGVGEDTADVDVYVPPMRRLSGNAYLHRVALYRNTVADPNTYRRASIHFSSGSPTLNQVSMHSPAATITITDTISDANIAGNELLYTTGGVLEDYPPPAMHAVATHRLRLFGIDSETGDIWGSKLFVPNEGIRLAFSLRISNPHPDDIPTALISEESALTVFYRSRIGRIYGDGPNDLGQGQWSEIEFLPSNTSGAISQRTTVATPRGIFFIDERRGPMLLPYGGQPQGIGHDWPIGNYDDDTIRGVDWLEDRDEIRVTFADGTYRSLHVELGAWSTGTVTANAVLQTAVWGQHHVVLDDSGAVLVENTGLSYTGTVPALVWESAWIKLSGLPGIQGRFKLKELYLIGEYVNTHGLTVRVSYDYNDTDYYELTYADGDLSTLTPYQVRCRPSKQNVQAIKVRVTETSPSTAGFKLSELMLEFGVFARGGRPRVPPAGVRV